MVLNTTKRRMRYHAADGKVDDDGQTLAARRTDDGTLVLVLDGADVPGDAKVTMAASVLATVVDTFSRQGVVAGAEAVVRSKRRVKTIERDDHGQISKITEEPVGPDSILLT